MDFVFGIVVFVIKKAMRINNLYLVCILVISTNCSNDKQSEFVIGNKHLVYTDLSVESSNSDKLMVNFYTKGYEMQFLDPLTKEPYSGTIVDDQSLYKGRYSIENGFMKELITYFEDGSPSYFAIYDEGQIEKMSSWYKDGNLRSKLSGGENWVYSYYNSENIQVMHIEDGIKTEYFDNGKIKTQVPFDHSNFYHGTATAYYSDGSVKAEFVFQSGKLINFKKLNSVM